MSIRNLTPAPATGFWDIMVIRIADSIFRNLFYCLPMEQTFDASPVFLSLQDATIRRYAQPVLSELDWIIRCGQQWAVAGPAGSGKTTLLGAVAGKIPLGSGTMRYHFSKNESGEPESPWQRIALVPGSRSFSRISHAPDQYYQQRFHSMDSEDFPLTREFLLDADFTAGRETANHQSKQKLETIAAMLDIAYLLDRRVVKLSNGETKRVLIAKALLSKPALLLLDNPFVGLDTQSREMLRKALDNISRTGVQLILATAAEEIPPAITHVLELKKGGVAGMYSRVAFLAGWEVRKTDASGNGVAQHYQPESLLPVPTPAFRVAVQMKDVNITYGRVKVLENINWTVMAGEKWALLGPNGSGKSTLLSLVNGDNPQAYANDIILFDRKKGSGESIWDIKRQIGYVSPELHAYYPKSATCFEAVASGFGDTTRLQRKPTPAEAAVASAYLQLLDMEPLRDVPLRQFSAGEVRLVLVARALVKRPPLLILDEPCQGLDTAYKHRIKELLEITGSHPHQTMIYVTHYPDEIPGCVDKVLRLKEGRVESAGGR